MAGKAEKIESGSSEVRGFGAAGEETDPQGDPGDEQSDDEIEEGDGDDGAEASETPEGADAPADAQALWEQYRPKAEAPDGKATEPVAAPAQASGGGEIPRLDFAAEYETDGQIMDVVNQLVERVNEQQRTIATLHSERRAMLMDRMEREAKKAIQTIKDRYGASLTVDELAQSAKGVKDAILERHGFYTADAFVDAFRMSHADYIEALGAKKEAPKTNKPADLARQTASGGSKRVDRTPGGRDKGVLQELKAFG